jgi:hypothetical protein
LATVTSDAAVANAMTPRLKTLANLITGPPISTFLNWYSYDAVAEA